MFQDFKELLSAFNARNVKYLVIGGYAVSFHAQPRLTKDLDLFILADPANARAAYDALSDFGAPLAQIRVEDLANPQKFLRFGQPPVAIDILSGVDGVNFEEAWERRVEGLIDAETGQKAYFISKEDLIASKLAAGRMRDLADVEEIREAEASLLDNDSDND
jgi:predicted nucleotidyltransferase